MGERLGRTGRWLLALLLSAFKFVVHILARLAAKIWRALGIASLKLRRGLTAASLWFWAFLGRLGLALRHLLRVLFWRPLGRLSRAIGRFNLRLGISIWAFVGRLGLAERHLLVLLVWRPFVDLLRRLALFNVRTGFFIWAFIGRLGLAFRDWLTFFVWKPLLFVTWPLRWLYARSLRRPVAFIWLSLRAFGQWIFVTAILPVAKAVWRALVARYGRPWRDFKEQLAESREKLHPSNLVPWLKGRWRALLHPSASAAAADEGRYSSPGPGHRRVRMNRFATALIALNVVILLGFISLQSRQTGDVIAQSGAVESGSLAASVLTLTPEPLPTVTPVVTTPTATVEPARQPDFWPTPDPLSSGGSVAFTLRQNGNADIYALTIGRSQPLRLTSSPADDRDPAWSPSGRQLAFSSNRDGNWEIYTLDLETRNVQRLTHDLAFDGGPSWSPDGKWLVYESYQENNLDLYILAADGGSPPIRLTEHPAQDFSPVWSPGGRHVAFTSYRSGNKDIFIMSLDSATDERALNVTSSPDQYEDHAAFDSKGHHIAYYDDGEGYELVFVRPLIDYRPSGPPISVGQGHHPSWSPDGSSVAYAHSNEAQSYLVASSIDAWNVAPQAYTSAGYIDDLAWSGAALPIYLESQPQDAANDVRLFIEQVSPPQESGPPYLLWEIAVDAPSPYLSDRVDQSFNALRQRVIDEVGWDFLGRLDNMYEPLAAKPQPGDTNKSWNKAGRAFDFYSRYPISIDPQVEVAREDRGAETYWRVYLKPAVQDGSRGEPLRQVPWDFQARFGSEPQYYDQGGKWKSGLPDGYYVDFTALAADYGWTRVPALENWRTFFQGIRYWHFENRQELTWESAILEIYSPDELSMVFGDS